MKTNKLLLSALAFSIMTPAIVAQIPMHSAEAAQSKVKETDNKEVAVAAAKADFKDIPTTHMYYHMITKMRDQGIINGYPDGTFQPNEPISRQHAAALITRAMKELPKTVAFQQPADLPVTHPYYNELKTLLEADLLALDSQGNVHPNKALTRAEMAKILTVGFGLKEKAAYDFKDTENSAYNPYVRALYSNGVTTGYEDGTFDLFGTLTRQHYAVFMYRAMNVDASFQAVPIQAKDIVLSPDMSLEQFNKTVLENPLMDNLVTEKNWVGPILWSQERNRIALTDGQALLKNTNFEFSLISPYITLSKPNWENRLSQDFLEAPIGIENDEGVSKIIFDHTEEDATNLGIEFIKLLYPEFDFTDMIQQKVKEGREALAQGNRNFANVEIIKMNGHEVQIGVAATSYYSYFVLRIQYPTS